MLRLWVPILPEHIWSKVDRQARPRQLTRNEPPIVGYRPLPDRSSGKKGKLRHARQANPDYWRAASPRSTRSSSSIYQNPDTMAAGPQARRASTCAMRHPAGAVQAAGSRSPSLTTNGRHTWHFDRHLACNCYDSADLAGQPGAHGRASSVRPSTGPSTSEKVVGARVPSGYATVGHASSRRTLRPELRTGSRRPTRPSTFDLEQGQADARRRRLQGHRRRRHPTRATGQERSTLRLWARVQDVARARSPASSSPAGSKDIGLKIDLPVDRRRRAHRRRSYNYNRRHLRARLRHVHLVLAAQRRRPGAASSTYFTHPADRGLERPHLVERRVR